MDPARRDAAKDAETMPVGVERHLVALQQVGPRARNARLCASFTWATCSLVRSPPMTAQSSLRSNWNASPGRTTPRRLLVALAARPPFARERRDTVVRAGDAGRNQIGMQLLEHAPPLAPPCRPRSSANPPAPRRGDRACSGCRELRLERAGLQVLPDRVARQAAAPRAIFVGKERAYNRRFQQMCSHYLVDPPSIGLEPMAPQ
jgi:hypothetical protein